MMACITLYGLIDILMPVIAFGVINQEWQFHIPLINVTYKPWRMFMVASALPELIAFVIMIFLPETPVFCLSQGKKEQTKQILQKMNRMNNGKDSKLEFIDIYEEHNSIESQHQNEEHKHKSIWNQIASIFKPPHLQSTLLVCLLQFIISYTSGGFYVFYAEILNKMAVNITKQGKICYIINSQNDTLLSNETIYEVINSLQSCKNFRNFFSSLIRCVQPKLKQKPYFWEFFYKFCTLPSILLLLF